MNLKVPDLPTSRAHTTKPEFESRLTESLILISASSLLLTFYFLHTYIQIDRYIIPININHINILHLLHQHSTLNQHSNNHQDEVLSNHLSWCLRRRGCCADQWVACLWCESYLFFFFFLLCVPDSYSQIPSASSSFGLLLWSWLGRCWVDVVVMRSRGELELRVKAR